ncbi:MAG: trypsin-like peptidase domain-containing protein [Methylophilaceae bacterium]|nr:trypsin-like peptidase domain-containing protein [Methylophilaceae bacterium]
MVTAMVESKTKLHSALLALCLLLGGVRPALAIDQQVLLKVFFSVVLVRGYDHNGGLAYGSGVVVGENQVVTNCHVLRNVPRAWVSQAEDAYPVEAVQADPFHDLCLLHINRLPLKPVEIGSTASLRKGAEVIAMGHSSGNPSPITSVGQVRSLYPFDGAHVIRSSARFTMGASGSPLFDAEGRLLGINTFKTPGRFAYFYAMPAEWIEALRKQPKQTRLPIEGQAFWELPDEAQPFFMQVALPHLHEEWTKLKEIGLKWTQTELQNAEAWYELGAAQEGLGETAQAEAAYRTAIQLDPHHSESLYRLGLFASKRGDREEAHRVNATLARIDPEMAQNFAKEAGCGREC